MSNTLTGLFGIAGIWLTMAMVPLIELLGLTGGQATFLRGISGLIVIGIAGIFVRHLITWPDKHTRLIVVLFVLATVCLFQAVQFWGANFSALFLDMALLVPLFLAWRNGQPITGKVAIASVSALFGTMLALRVFAGETLSWAGLGFSIGALLFNGLFIQYAGRAKQGNWNKAFWMSVGLVAVGLPSFAGIALIPETGFSGLFVLLVLVFSLATGVVNFYSAFIAFKHLSPVSVGVLVLGVTPVIMLSSYFLLGRDMSFDQIIGVGITLVSVLLFAQVLQKDKE